VATIARRKKGNMPVLDAKALKTDPKGLKFLRDVLRREQPVAAESDGGREPARSRPSRPSSSGLRAADLPR
jgi:hypothetical protein